MSNNVILPSKYQLFEKVVYKYDNNDDETKIGQIISVRFTPQNVIYNLVNFKTGELNVEIEEALVSAIN